MKCLKLIINFTVNQLLILSKCTQTQAAGFLYFKNVSYHLSHILMCSAKKYILDLLFLKDKPLLKYCNLPDQTNYLPFALRLLRIVKRI